VLVLLLEAAVVDIISVENMYWVLYAVAGPR
jgi:hypothetical protein